MATLYVSEYDHVVSLLEGANPVAQEPALAEQHIAIGASSVQGSAFSSVTRFVRVHTDAICSIAIGTSPTAVATAKRMAANSTEYFGVRGGDTIAVITNT
jgi:hypothetical protein